MKKQLYKIGQVVSVKSCLGNSNGTITEIDKSRGTYKGWLYKINTRWFREDEITHVLEHVQMSPTEYSDLYKKLDYNLNNAIYKLVKAYGKRHTYVNGYTRCTIKLPQTYHIWVCNTHGKAIQLNKAYIHFNGKEYVRGYLFFEDTEGNTLSIETDLISHAELPIYSRLYDYVFRKELK